MDKDMIKSLLKKGLVQIFSANLINKFVQFGAIIILTRLISKSDYGAFSYAQNQLNMILLFEGLGVTSGILQYCSSQKKLEDKIVYFKFGIKVGIVFNIILSIGTLVYSMTHALAINNSNFYLSVMAFIPILSITFNCIQYYTRALLKNVEFSRVTTVNSILYLLFTCTLSYFYGVNGLIIGMYLAYFFSIVFACIQLKSDIIQVFKCNVTIISEQKLTFLKYSVVTVLTNAMSQILYLLDTYLVGKFTGNEQVLANYRVATLIPFNLTFIPLSLMVFAYPYFVQNAHDKDWVKHKIKLLDKYLFLINLVITAVSIVFAKYILIILFGSNYADATGAFRILMIGYLVSGSFRIPYGNILASLGRVKDNFYNSIFSGVANVILDIILIKYYGSNGAAIATLAVFIISSAIHRYNIYRYFKREA